ncbi:MAG: lipopolysaccharide biosynthesis protein [Gemmatimonadales bacterium]
MIPSRDALVRQTLDGTVRVFLAEALLVPTGLATAAFLTRRLGPAGYGLFALSATVVAWIEWGVAAFFSRAAIKIVSEAEDWRPAARAVLWLHLAMSLVTAAALWAGAPALAALLGEPALAGYLRLFAIEIPLFSAAQAQRSILIGRGDFRPRAVASAGRWIARMVMIIFLVDAGLAVPGAILGSIGATLVELAIGRYYVRIPLRGPAAFPREQLWTYGLPLFVFAVAARLYDRLDLLLLKALGGTAAQAGFYGGAQNLALMPGIFALSFSPLLLSTLIRAVRAGLGESARGMGQDAMRLVFLLLPFAALTSGTADELVVLLLGPVFRPAGPLLALLIFGAIALTMISVATAVLTAAERPAWTVGLAVPMLAAAMAGHMALIPRWGSLGAALVTTVVAVGGAVAATAAVARVWRILPPRATVLRSLAVSAGAYMAAVLWPASGPLLLVKLSVISLTCAGTLAALGEFRLQVRPFWSTLGVGGAVERER